MLLFRLLSLIRRVLRACVDLEMDWEWQVGNVYFVSHFIYKIIRDHSGIIKQDDEDYGGCF
jgi:hypothetical protein